MLFHNLTLKQPEAQQSILTEILTMIERWPTFINNPELKTKLAVFADIFHEG